jgi:uncharacterized Zn finger protein (UPF0148 family)
MKNPTYFGQIYCPSSGISTLYVVHTEREREREREREIEEEKRICFLIIKANELL